MNSSIATLLMGLLFGAGLLVCHLLHLVFKIPAEWTRKIAHVLSCVFALFFPLVFDSVLPILILALCFSAILGVLQIKKLFPALFSVARGGLGVIAICWGFVAVFLLASSIPFLYISSLLVLGISDTASALPGLLRKPKAKRKTRLGASVFLLTAFLILLISGLQLSDLKGLHLLLFCLSASAASAAIESLSPVGLDNLSIPLLLPLLYHLYMFSVPLFLITSLVFVVLGITRLLILLHKEHSELTPKIGKKAKSPEPTIKDITGTPHA